ncbi:uncharacterized protein LOC141686492 [Apium graveolens]|uniref:uncharacterized protein LOC141686492 n=1 Tax=Apium graveolens TaxID=4045 RepID=UPI003D793F41
MAATIDISQNPTSPYYIHPSDNPGMKLVSTQFDGTGYTDWKRSMLLSLTAKNKTGFIDGSIEKPSVDDDAYKAWDICNSMLISWLLGVLDQSIARSVLYFKSARDIWVNLEERYGQTSGTLLFSLQQALHEVRQGQDSISTYYTKIKMIWDQLDSIDPIPSCECAQCACFITQKLVKSQDDRRLVEFLMKLSDGFEVIRGSILVMSPLPTISHAYRLLLQEENHKKLYQNSHPHEGVMAFAANRRNFPDKYKQQGYNRQNIGGNYDSGKGRISYYCDHCKVPRHSIQRCYKIHGYPQNFKERKISANACEGQKDDNLNADNNMGFTPTQYQ